MKRFLLSICLFLLVGVCSSILIGCPSPQKETPVPEEQTIEETAPAEEAPVVEEAPAAEEEAEKAPAQGGTE